MAARRGNFPAAESAPAARINAKPGMGTPTWRTKTTAKRTRHPWLSTNWTMSFMHSFAFAGNAHKQGDRYRRGNPSAKRCAIETACKSLRINSPDCSMPVTGCRQLGTAAMGAVIDQAGMDEYAVSLCLNRNKSPVCAATRQLEKIGGQEVAAIAANAAEASKWAPLSAAACVDLLEQQGFIALIVWYGVCIRG